MGRTVPTMTQMIQMEEAAFANFRRALRREDQRRLDTLFALTRQHTAAISQANHALPLEVMLLAMVLEQQRAIEALQRQVGD
jgi:hypothetical protein